ncbi:peptide-methionine (S)-S-oxide reductase MsrA [Agarilytica rhodophyticola]|uniref:peptide-methionine (S)-S-oxide reductase MsrA n=1 Tax=Agarilytica rhodophyticola TaxID=1737490 RepID=UPI000B349536|nr:peptide-methionine (S)-S-oxide reductase MsrA [Agarilytica rhodophyticola]
MLTNKAQMPSAETALDGRQEALVISDKHFVLDSNMKAPFPDDTSSVLLGMGCFWGAERRIWQQQGVHTTAAVYAGGFTPNPTYEEVCSGMTGHTEAVLTVYKNSPEALENILKVFWESHDPTQGMRQGNDLGTQYRSAIYVFNEEQKDVAQKSLASYQDALKASGLGAISTEIKVVDTFYYAEEYHQQYLAKNPNGYCGIGGTGVCFID